MSVQLLDASIARALAAVVERERRAETFALRVTSAGARVWAEHPDGGHNEYELADGEPVLLARHNGRVVQPLHNSNGNES